MRSPAVDTYIFSFSEEIRLIMEVLRDQIVYRVPQVEESIKFNCPFYSFDGLLCYINWDKKARKVALGFVEGFLIQDHYGVFNPDTKQVKKIFYSTVEQIDETILTDYLEQAIQINRFKKKNFLRTSKG